jgi:hypothetical protein
MITGEQIKAARKPLGWSQMTLALEESINRLLQNSREGKSDRRYSAFLPSSAALRAPASSSRKGTGVRLRSEK